MMKMIALATALTFVFALPALAEQTVTKKPVPFMSGTITRCDDAAKKATVKDPAGKETSFGWNEKTTVTGTVKVGEHAFVWSKTDKDGKVWATRISVGTKLVMSNLSAGK